MRDSVFVMSLAMVLTLLLLHGTNLGAGADSPTAPLPTKNHKQGGNDNNWTTTIIVLVLFGLLFIFLLFQRPIISLIRRFWKPSTQIIAPIPMTCIVTYPPHTSIGFGAVDCQICQEPYIGGITIRVLPVCRHIFHIECLDRWFSQGHSDCPICRQQYPIRYWEAVADDL